MRSQIANYYIALIMTQDAKRRCGSEEGRGEHTGGIYFIDSALAGI